MGLSLSTDQLDPRHRAEYWHGTLESVLGKSEVVHTEPMAVQCELVAREAGDLVLLNSRSTPFHSYRVDRHIRGDDRNNLTVGVMRRGTIVAEQDDRRVRRGPGTVTVTVTVADLTRPYAAIHSMDHEIFGFSIARERFERVFGSSKRFTMMPIDETLGSTPIVAFLTSLYDNAERMAPEVTAEMADVGVELVMNGLARRLAMEPALPQSTALLLHRAQGFVAANLPDPALNPAMIASALGISLRHLQALFRRRQTTPSDWIWHKRLACARERLASPGFAAVSVGEVAYGCGFTDQGHFSRRFEAAFGLSPRDWRQSALLGSETTTGRTATR